MAICCPVQMISVSLQGGAKKRKFRGARQGLPLPDVAGTQTKWASWAPARALLSA